MMPGRRCSVPMSATMAKSTSLTQNVASAVQYLMSAAVIISTPAPTHAPAMTLQNLLNLLPHWVCETYLEGPRQVLQQMTCSLGVMHHQEDKLTCTELCRRNVTRSISEAPCTAARTGQRHFSRAESEPCNRCFIHVSTYHERSHIAMPS